MVYRIGQGDVDCIDVGISGQCGEILVRMRHFEFVGKSAGFLRCAAKAGHQF